MKIFVFSAACVTRQTLSREDSRAAVNGFFDGLMTVSTKLSLSIVDSPCLLWSVVTEGSPVSVPLCTSVRFSNMLFDGNFEVCFSSLCGKKITLRDSHIQMHDSYQGEKVVKVCGVAS